MYSKLFKNLLVSNTSLMSPETTLLLIFSWRLTLWKIHSSTIPSTKCKSTVFTVFEIGKSLVLEMEIGGFWNWNQIFVFFLRPLLVSKKIFPYNFPLKLQILTLFWSVLHSSFKNKHTLRSWSSSFSLLNPTWNMSRFKSSNATFYISVAKTMLSVTQGLTASLKELVTKATKSCLTRIPQSDLKCVSFTYFSLIFRH